MAEEPKREIRTCKTCGRELTSWKSPFCSDDCYAAYSGPTPDKPLPQAVKVLDEPKQPVSTKRQRANGKQALEPRVSKRGVINEGRPTKATPARIKAILGYIADNYTEAQACALAGIHPSNWIDWKKNTDRYPELRAKAEALWIRSKLKRKRELADKKLDWKEPAWRSYVKSGGGLFDPNSFASPFPDTSGSDSENPMSWSYNLGVDNDESYKDRRDWNRPGSDDGGGLAGFGGIGSDCH